MEINKFVLSVQEAQYVLGASSRTIYRLIHQNILYAYKDHGGRIWKIPEQSIINYFNIMDQIYHKK